MKFSEDVMFYMQHRESSIETLEAYFEKTKTKTLKDKVKNKFNPKRVIRHQIIGKILYERGLKENSLEKSSKSQSLASKSYPLQKPAEI